MIKYQDKKSKRNVLRVKVLEIFTEMFNEQPSYYIKPMQNLINIKVQQCVDSLTKVVITNDTNKFKSGVQTIKMT